MKASKHKSLHLPILIEQDEDGVYIVSLVQLLKAVIPLQRLLMRRLNIKEVIEMCIAEEKPTEPNSTLIKAAKSYESLLPR